MSYSHSQAVAVDKGGKAEVGTGEVENGKNGVP